MLSYLNGTTSPLVRNLYVIGYPENPYSIFLTDHDSPLYYALYPQKNFAVGTVSRGSIPCKIGLEAGSVDITWSPSQGSYSATVGSADPRTLAQQGFYDNWPVTILAGFMPTPGDVNTLGCAVLWKGIVGQMQIDRKQIKITVNSLMVALDQKVPTNVIEATNSLANYTAARPPTGFTTIPVFTVFTGSTDTIIYGDVLPPYGTNHIFTTNVFQNGWLIFQPANGATLAPGAPGGFWSPISGNSEFIDGFSVHHNQFNLVSPLPWPPTPWSGSAGDQFLVSMPVPTSGEGYPFEYVPVPESAV